MRKILWKCDSCDRTVETFRYLPHDWIQLYHKNNDDHTHSYVFCSFQCLSQWIDNRGNIKEEVNNVEATF